MSAHDHHSDPLPDTAQGILAEDRAHLFYSWSAQRQLSPMPVARALGSYFWDYDGNRYLDFASQFVHVNIGHQHPKVVAAIQRQAERLCTVSPAFGNDQRARAARLIAERAPGDLDRVLFTNGGTDAVEHAVRMARLVTGRPKVLAAYRSYHGGSHLTLHMTGDPRRWPIDTGAAGVVHFFGPYLYRSAFHARTEPEEAQRALAHLEQVIALEGPGTVAAVILEPVVGTNGVLVPPEGYLAGVRELCDRHGILLIADEVMAGFGRTGRWFAVQNWDVVPDLITFAKGVNSGYVPLGGVLMGPRVFDAFADRPYPGGLTYSGHPLACAAAVAAITAMSEEGIVENAPTSVPRYSAPVCGSCPNATRSSVRYADWACSGRWSWCGTGTPARCCRRWGRPAVRPVRWTSWPRPAVSAGSGRSCTPTGSTSCRRAP